MKTVDELWMDFDEQNLALYNALTVLYGHLSEIETQYSQLNETLIALKT